MQTMNSMLLVLVSIMISLSRMAELPGAEDSTVIYRDQPVVAQKLQKFIDSGLRNFQVITKIRNWWRNEDHVVKFYK